MGNFTTRINWDNKDVNDTILNNIYTICRKHQMEKVTREDGINVIGEDKILEDNSVLLKMNRCIENIKDYLTSENINYDCEDTKVWYTLL